MKKVILDMDPGIDDALALMLALRSPEIRVLGITTVAGNAPLQTTSANALRVLEHIGATLIPVAAGAARPLQRPLVDASDYHGPDGLGQCGLPPPTLSLHPSSAWDFMAELVLAQPGEITLVATGPLTNVALAFQRYPKLPESLCRLVLMGGAYDLTPFGRGNTTPFAEFNIWEDPEAASTVFHSQVDIFAVGLDVSTDPASCLTAQHVKRLKASNAPCGRLAATLADYVTQRHGRCELHDPLALACALDSSLFDFLSVPVQVLTGDGDEQGVTRLLHLEETAALPPIHVAAGVDGPRFLRLFLSRILEEQDD